MSYLYEVRSYRGPGEGDAVLEVVYANLDHAHEYVREMDWSGCTYVAIVPIPVIVAWVYDDEAGLTECGI